MEGESLTDDEEHDMYIAQLRDVFNGCDTTGSGKLDRNELLVLCDKLQLEDQSEFLVNELLVDADEVEFDHFKESFINILSKTGVAVQSSEEEDGEIIDESKDHDQTSEAKGQGQTKNLEDEEMESGESDSSIKREVSPKYIVGKKRYGRRSMPFSADDFECLADDEDDIEVASSTKSLKHSLVVHDLSDTEEDGSESQKKRRKKEGIDSGTDDDLTETFEAEGQIDHMMAENLTEEEQYLRGIWNNLKVGQNGYIDIQELGQVCTYIGMEEMNQTQLQQLFDKLDADGDGRVSFQEFLNELFQHSTPGKPGVATPRSVGTTPTRTLASPARALSAQKKLKYPSGDDRTTPSIVQGSGAAGLFTILDPERTGFAKAEDLIDLWEKYNVTNGADVLIGLGFDLSSKVNLSELSVCLEQALISADEQNLVYLAATASYQQEIRHLKSSLEQMSWAKEKLKLDLAESNARNSLLAKEVDERHASIEKSSESKLLSVEKKYQEQVKILQSELDKERENLSNLAVKHKQNLDTEMGELKQEEAKLREQLLQSQKELEKIGRDFEDISGQLDETTKQNQRLQRELENVHDLHRKLAEYESSSFMSPGEQKFTHEKLQRLEEDNKDLKDQNDELTAELEHWKQQIVPNRRPAGQQEQSEDENEDVKHTPIRKDGSFLSQYFTPVVLKKPSYVSPECSDDEMSRQGSAQGRRLPSAPNEEDNIIKTLKSDLAKLGITYGKGIRLLKSALRTHSGVGSTADKDRIEQLQTELRDLRDQFEIEKKEIEQGYKLEIAGIEECQDKDKELYLKHLQTEKEKISQEFERLQQAALAELAQDLQTTFAHEKEELIRKFNTEKNHLEHKHSEEKEIYSQKIKEEYEEDAKAQIEEFKVKYEQEKFQLEETLAETEPFIKKLEDQKLNLEQKLKKQAQESERALGVQKSELEFQLDTVRKDSEQALSDQKSEYELKLRQNSEEKDRALSAQKSELEDKLKQLRQESDKALSDQRAEMEDLLTRHMQKLEDVEKDRQNLDIKFKKEINENIMLRREDRLEQESALNKLNQDIRELKRLKAEAELEFKQQREELEIAFRQEKQELKVLYEGKINELEDINRNREKQQEQLLKEGISGLSGKLKEDFYDLMKDATKQEVEKAREELLKDLKKEEKDLQLHFDTKQSELCHIFEREKEELVEKYENQIRLLREELTVLQERLEEEREALGQRFESEKEAIEEVLAQQLREEIEEEVCHQMEEIRDAYEEEKREYELQTKLLKNELEDLHKELEREEKNRKKIDELSKTNKTLQQEKRKAEKHQAELADTLESTKRALEARIDELVSEKEGAITAVKAEFVESSKQSGKEKALYDAAILEKSLLEQQLIEMKTENSNLQQKIADKEQSQKHQEQLERENNQAVRNQAIPEHAQRAIDELTEEKSELEERLVDTENRLAEVNDMAQKYTHLQFDFGQMSIGQTALEETLMETQERLADMEAKFNQSERELKDASRYKDRYKLLQRKYEDVCKERDKISSLAKNLKEQLNSATTASKEEHDDKGNLTKVLEEKKQLEQQLQRVSDKLLEATTNFAVSQSQHIRQLQQWKDQSSNMIDLEKYTKLQIDLVDNQRSLRDMQEAVTSKEEMSNKMFKEREEKHKENVHTLEYQKESLERKLKTLQQVLDGQINKFKEQFEAGEKRNALVVDLYKENADLMDALCKVEGQKKDAVSRCYKLEDQCNNLKKMLKKMTTIAMK